MRFQTLLGYCLGFVALWQLALASSEVTEEPEVIAVASFPEANAFGHVVNGESNKLIVAIENKSGRNITLDNIAGSFHYVESNRLLKNTTAAKYKLPLLEGGKLQLPYQFYSEYRPGDLRLNVWLEHTTDGKKYRVLAYDSIVTIVEPEGSIFDFKLWITYLIVIGFFGGLGYFAYLTYLPQPKKRTKVPATPTTPVVGTTTATSTGGYEEEWIPEHHLKKPKQRKGRASGALTSGDETSGTELSGPEGRKAKSKK
ncbi:hypothetical protein NLI96_g6345 [Meripilus lineatus]|uniref:Translocon-associated protein subunit alpha n=1 Tax=Meripilus lineatus TaxID=2056292 RepID=A0AAD5V2V3_9APHY|nr:hypothetical protein NLI96_g6345 [Physisporinus lineatus]